MNNGYVKYLIFLILTIMILITVLIITLLRLRKREGKPVGYEINCGNVSIMFDNRENVTIIPYVKDKFGAGRATAHVLSLNSPYSKDKLGQAVRECMLSCCSGKPCTTEELSSKLGFTDWKEFSEGRRNISVHYKQGYGIILNTTSRNSDGAYRFNYGGFEKVIPAHINDRELGDIILELLRRCRC